LWKFKQLWNQLIEKRVPYFLIFFFLFFWLAFNLDLGEVWRVGFQSVQSRLTAIVSYNLTQSKHKHADKHADKWKDPEAFHKFRVKLSFLRLAGFHVSFITRLKKKENV
jgi:hypothetical protein